MPIITSISGIRGTVGAGKDNLNPVNFVNYVLSFGEFLKQGSKAKKIKIVVGRDARISGEMFLNLAVNSLISLGIDVVNIDLASTPTIEMTVIKERAAGAIIISASHNPKEWNALKLLNFRGEFLNKKDGLSVLQINERQDFSFVGVDDLGQVIKKDNYNDYHISEILKLKLVDKKKIASANFKIVVDAINSVGGVIIKKLLNELGVANVIIINNDMDGKFNHNPEPIEKNLKQLSRAVIKTKADLGIAVDPDVDRLALVNNLGEIVSEEYTLVAIADYVFKNFKKGRYNKASVSNLSSSWAMVDLADKHKARHYFSAVGEVNVVAEMRKRNAVIGGEGNGGIIFPELHHGRDAVVGVALFLSYLVSENKTCSELQKTWPQYYLLKEKIEFDDHVDIDKIFKALKEEYVEQKLITTDGLKIIFKNKKNWVHFRKSNTEPIVRIYCEAQNKKEAEDLFKTIKNVINKKI